MAFRIGLGVSLPWLAVCQLSWLAVCQLPWLAVCQLSSMVSLSLPFYLFYYFQFLVDSLHATTWNDKQVLQILDPANKLPKLVHFCLVWFHSVISPNIVLSASLQQCGHNCRLLKTRSRVRIYLDIFLFWTCGRSKIGKGKGKSEIIPPPQKKTGTIGKQYLG